MQESELTKIIPLICLSAIWGHNPIFTPWVSSGLTVGSGCNLMAASWQNSFLLEFLQGSPAHHPWWLQLLITMTSLLVKNLPAMQETWVLSLGWEDPLQNGKATHCVFCPGEFHGLYSPWGCKEVDTTKLLSPSLWHLWLLIWQEIFHFSSPLN